LRSGAADECEEETGGGEDLNREHQPTVAISAIKTQAPAIVQRVAPSVFGIIAVRFSELNRAGCRMQFSNRNEDVEVR